MARPIKEGLNYFPLDVDIFDDPKLLFIEDRFGVKGELVTIKLLCWIYQKGYKCEWNDEHAMIFAKKNFSSIKASLCIEIVNELLKRGFFNEALFKSFGVLTSCAIQERWLNVINNSKRKSVLIPELTLLVTELTTAETELTRAETELSTQRKLKESKEKETKRKKGDVSESFEAFWNAYDKKINRPKAEKKWNSFSKQTQNQILNYIPEYKKAQPDKKYRKDPMTFFNNTAWEDEVIVETTSATNQPVAQNLPPVYERT